jgi:transcriptional regulator with GAF, ATPase, and Fis domain
MEQDHFDAMIVDLMLPDTDGLGVIQRAADLSPSAVKVVVTGYASLESAMKAVRLGAYDYVRKPFEAEELLRIIRRGLKEQELARRNEQLLEELDAANQQLREAKEQLEDQVEVTTEKLDAFSELGKRLAGSDGAYPNLRDILDAAMQMSGARTGGIFRCVEEGYHCILAEGEAASDLENVRLKLEEYVLAEALSSGEPVVVDNLVAPREVPNDLGLLGLLSCIALPLIYQHQTRGMLVLFDQEAPLPQEMQFNLLRVLAAQAAGLLDSEQLRRTSGDDRDDDFVELSEML